MSVQPLLASLPTRHDVMYVKAAVPCSRPVLCSAAYGPVLRSPRHLHHISCHSSSSQNWSRSGKIQARRRPARFPPTCSQASMEEGDSSGRQGTDFPDNRANSLSHWSFQGSATPVLLSPVLALQDGIRKVRAKGLVQSSREGFQEAYSRLKTVDGKLVFENIRQSSTVAEGKRIWHQQEPWIKWPISIFVTLYLAIFISCGTVVAQDLIPLWIMGPIIAGVTIRGTYSIVGFSHRCLVKSEPMWQAARSGTSELYEDAKKGKLVSKTRSVLELKNRELKEAIAKRKSDFTVYIRSGQAASDSKALFLRESSRFRDWSMEKSEDFVEWIEPSWRAFTRLMKKLF